MVAVTTYTSKGGSVSTTEADANFTNLNTGKVEDALSFPSIRPSLMLDFVNGLTLDPRITFTRSSTATFVGSNGLIQTAAANVPRFDFDPVTLACRGLLLEEQRTNLFTYSEDFSDASWSNVIGNTSTRSNAAASFGFVRGLIIPTSSSGGVRRSVVSLTSGVAYTLSFYLEASSVFIQFENGSSTFGSPHTASLNVSTGAATSVLGFTSVSSVAFGSGRVFTLVTAPAGGSLGANIEWVGAFGNPFYLGRPQFEAGSFATSYIPTAGSQVTRSADTQTISTSSAWYAPDAGTVYVDFDLLGASASVYPRLLSWNGGGSNFFEMNSVSMLSNNPAVGTLNGLTHLDGTKAAYAWSSASRVVTADGQTPVTATTTVGPVSISSIEFLGSGGYKGSGHIKKFEYYPRRLTNAQLQALTTI